MRSKVSIAMGNYNCAPYIEEAVDSIIAQTYKDWELIIVDDCSNDNSLKIIDRLKTSKFNIIKNYKNIGPALSRNKAINIAKREIYCIYRFR